MEPANALIQEGSSNRTITSCGSHGATLITSMNYSPGIGPSDAFDLQGHGSSTLLTDNYNDASSSYLACPLSNSTQPATYVLFAATAVESYPPPGLQVPTGNTADCIPLKLAFKDTGLRRLLRPLLWRGPLPTTLRRGARLGMLAHSDPDPGALARS